MITLRKILGLSSDDWKAIGGSRMHIAMLTNRIAAVKPLIAERKIMNAWCMENCTSTYYYEFDSASFYFLSKTDATHFWLAMSGYTYKQQENQP